MTITQYQIQSPRAGLRLTRSSGARYSDSSFT